MAQPSRKRRDEVRIHARQGAADEAKGEGPDERDDGEVEHWGNLRGRELRLEGGELRRLFRGMIGSSK